MHQDLLYFIALTIDTHEQISIYELCHHLLAHIELSVYLSVCCVTSSPPNWFVKQLVSF